MGKKNKLAQTLIIFSFMALTLVYVGCQKQSLNSNIPVVKIISVTASGTGYVIVAGAITSNKGDSVQEEGFCYGTDPVPPVTERQTLLTTVKDTFTARLPIKQDSTYYFRCFAANTYGYAVSNPVKH